MWKMLAVTFEGVVMDVRRGKYVDYYLTILGLVLITITNLFQVQEQLSTAAILVALTLILLNIVNSHKQNETSQRIYGITDFRPERELPPLETSFNLAKKDVLMVGVGLGSLDFGQPLQPFENALKRGCVIRILLLSPYRRDGTLNPVVEIADKQTKYTSNRRLINDKLTDFVTYRSRLAENLQENLQLRCYDNIPSTAAMLVDTCDEHGFIRVEPVVTGLPPQHRPSFDVKASSSRDLYLRLRECYNNLWNDAQSIEDIVAMRKMTSNDVNAPKQS